MRLTEVLGLKLNPVFIRVSMGLLIRGVCLDPLETSLWTLSFFTFVCLSACQHVILREFLPLGPFYVKEMGISVFLKHFAYCERRMFYKCKQS